MTRPVSPHVAAEHRRVIAVLATGGACSLAISGAVGEMAGATGLWVLIATGILLCAAAARGLGADP